MTSNQIQILQRRRQRVEDAYRKMRLIKHPMQHKALEAAEDVIEYIDVQIAELRKQGAK